MYIFIAENIYLLDIHIIIPDTEVQYWKAVYLKVN